MKTELTSEHNRKEKVTTILSIIVVGVLSLIGFTGAGSAFYMRRTGQVSWWHALIIGCAGIGFGLLFGAMVFKFIFRMLPVRRVLLFKGGELGIVTWRGKIFVAKLPDNIKYLVKTGNNLTAALYADNHYFVIDSEQYSDNDRITEFLRPYYPYSRKKERKVK